MKDWNEELLSSVADEEALTEKAEELRKELLDSFESRDEVQSRVVLETLSELFSQDAQAVVELLDRVSLYLCSPCLVLGCLSSECCSLSFKVVKSICGTASAREVFTGLTDGVSLLLETASYPEMSRVVPIVLDSLVSCLSRISRKKDHFCSLSLQLIYRIAKKLRDSFDAEQDRADEIPLCTFLKSGFRISREYLTASLRLKAFAILVVECFLCLLVWKRTVQLGPSEQLDQDTEEEIGELLLSLQFPHTSIEEAVLLMAEAWYEDGEDSDDEGSDRCSAKTELTHGCCLLTWLSLQHPKIPTLFTDDLKTVISTLLRVEHGLAGAHCVQAALDMIRVCQMQPSQMANAAFWREVCSRLIWHMEHNPVLQIKAEAANSLQAVLKAMPEEQRWALIKEFAFTPCFDIAALIVQSLRASVVQACTSDQARSTFNSAEILDLMMDLIKDATSEEDLIERTELYTAVLNLYFFLIVRQPNCNMPLLDRVNEVSEKMEVKLRSLQSQLTVARTHNEAEMRLVRLQMNVSKVLEHRTK